MCNLRAGCFENGLRVGIQKPVVTYDIVNYYGQAVFPDLLSAWPNTLVCIMLNIFIIDKVLIKYLRAILFKFQNDKLKK
jgi:hypothetical protein